MNDNIVNNFYPHAIWQWNMNKYKLARDRCEKFKIIARDVKPDTANKCYLRIPPTFDLANKFVQHDIHGYEMINEDKPLIEVILTLIENEKFFFWTLGKKRLGYDNPFIRIQFPRHEGIYAVFW